MEIVTVGPHIMSAWKTTKEKNKEKEKLVSERSLCFCCQQAIRGTEMDDRKHAPNLFLIPFFHKIGT